MITIIQKYIQIQDICVLANVQTNLRQQPRGMKAGYILFNWVDVTRPADIIHYPQMKGKIFIIFSSRFLFLDYDRVTLHDSQFIIILYWFFLLMMSWFHPVHPLCDLTCLALEKPFPHWFFNANKRTEEKVRGATEMTYLWYQTEPRISGFIAVWTLTFDSHVLTSFSEIWASIT